MHLAYAAGWCSSHGSDSTGVPHSAQTKMIPVSPITVAASVVMVSVIVGPPFGRL